MDIRYLYLDDQDDTTLTSICQAVSGDANGDHLEIECKHPLVLGSALSYLEKEISNYDGIILDWRLDEIPQAEKDRFTFRAASVAQEIRTRQTEGILEPMPIVLWSTDEQLKNSYTPDLSSHDLFDESHEKIEIGENSMEVREQLISLSTGYSAIEAIRSSGKPLSTVLEIGSTDNFSPSFVDFISTFENEAAHVIALQIMRKMIKRPGVLIDENLLAARLGIDIEGSKDWTRLVEFFVGYCYHGPFGQKHSRWWWDDLIQGWWMKMAEVPVNIFSLSANERVELIRKNTELTELSSAEPIEEHYSNYYQTICEYYGRPLDRVDGVIVDETDPAPWQDRRYLSLKAALGRLADPKVLRPHPSEHQRLSIMAAE